MLFAYEIAFEKSEADRAMTVSFELDTSGFETRYIQAMKDKFLWEALLLIVRMAPDETRGSIRSVKRQSPTAAQLQAIGMPPEPADLTDWALREFGDADAAVPNYG